jgi:hypothetical protein
MKYLLFLFTTITFAQSIKFVPIDDDTLEFIDEASYTLFSNKKPIYTNLTSKDSITRLPNNIVFDSIAFNKMFYKPRGYSKETLPNVVRLKKIVYELNEIIVTNTKPSEIAIGEKSRFIKSRSNGIARDLSYGLLFRKDELKNMSLKRLLFYVEKVKYKTTYKVKFYAAKENEGTVNTHQTLDVNELLFESPVLTLEKGTKNEVEVNLEEYDIDLKDKNIFVCLELQDNFDENNNVIQLQFKDATKIKFQLSKWINYYGKTIDYHTKITDDSMININTMVNNDFAFMFFKKPHRSNLVAPAIILYATKN